VSQEKWDHETGVVVTGVLHAPGGAGAEIGFAVLSTVATTPQPGPTDAGPVRKQ
jgi:hypothetical protein